MLGCKVTHSHILLRHVAVFVWMHTTEECLSLWFIVTYAMSAMISVCFIIDIGYYSNKQNFISSLTSF